mmetsp:Transcript_9379/g.28192  ORF Transcript_9379/g.28192 Transcript_9379/m.28192 type:complete len:221 (-) Transcript_9379:284-946(-)
MHALNASQRNTRERRSWTAARLCCSSTARRARCSGPSASSTPCWCRGAASLARRGCTGWGCAWTPSCTTWPPAPRRCLTTCIPTRWTMPPQTSRRTCKVPSRRPPWRPASRPPPTRWRWVRRRHRGWPRGALKVRRKPRLWGCRLPWAPRLLLRQRHTVEVSQYHSRAYHYTSCTSQPLLALPEKDSWSFVLFQERAGLYLFGPCCILARRIVLFAWPNL